MSELPPIYTALAVGKGVAQDHIILQNAFVACCLEAAAATTTVPILTSTFAQDIGALVFASVSIESYSQGVAAIFYAYDLPSILPLILPLILLEHWSHIETLNLKMICVVWMS